MKKISFIIFLFIFLSLGISNAWALPRCVGTWSVTNWNNCLGTYKWDTGDMYVGEYKNGNRHGKGTYTFPNGDKYVGDHNYDKRNGQGTFTWANGDKYVGQHINVSLTVSSNKSLF